MNERMRRAARDKILAGSLDVFAERGFAAASMQEIADQSGVSKGLLYHYFDSKEELLVAAIRSRLDSLLEVTDRIGRYEAPADRLAGLIDGLIQHVVERPAVFRLYLTLTMQTSVGARERAGADLREPLEAYLRRIQDLFGELGSSDAEVDALLFRSALLGICLRLAAGETEVPIAALRARLLEVFASRARSGGERS